MTFAFLVWAWDKFVCFFFRNAFFALLLFYYSFYFVWLSTLLVDFACVILISSNGNICYSLFTLIVTCFFLFVLRYVYLVCFLFYFNLKTLCLQSRMLNSYKWLKMKEVKVVICIVLLFILLSLCLCVLLDNLTITSSGHWFSFVAILEILLLSCIFLDYILVYT